jgi:hypothetical protein
LKGTQFEINCVPEKVCTGPDNAVLPANEGCPASACPNGCCDILVENQFQFLSCAQEGGVCPLGFLIPPDTFCPEECDAD